MMKHADIFLSHKEANFHIVKSNVSIYDFIVDMMVRRSYILCSSLFDFFATLVI